MVRRTKDAFCDGVFVAVKRPGNQHVLKKGSWWRTGGRAINAASNFMR